VAVKTPGPPRKPSVRKKKAAARPAARKPTTPTARRPVRAQPGTPEELIATLPEPRRGEMARLHQLIRATVPDLPPFVHQGMIGYGPFHYRYASGREGDWFRIGVASRKQYIALYSCAADERGYVAERYRQRLPAADIGRSCVRFRRVDDLDQAALVALLKETAVTGFGL
jgi:hypothetical protein